VVLFDFGLVVLIPFSCPRNEMASTEDLHISNLFSLKDHVCLVTGGGKQKLDFERSKY
jgi:hypothetical protein